jgi:hypothetical protein
LDAHTSYTILHYSWAASVLLGYNSVELQRKSLGVLLGSLTDRDLLKMALSQGFSGHANEVDLVLYNKNSDPLFCAVSVYPIHSTHAYFSDLEVRMVAFNIVPYDSDIPHQSDNEVINMNSSELANEDENASDGCTSSGCSSRRGRTGIDGDTTSSQTDTYASSDSTLGCNSADSTDSVINSTSSERSHSPPSSSLSHQDSHDSLSSCDPRDQSKYRAMRRRHNNKVYKNESRKLHKQKNQIISL